MACADDVHARYKISERERVLSPERSESVLTIEFE